ncbi:D-alanyl-D-alanine carboxypeptidase family protein [Staphylococcus sp. NRL 16/872]|uniref:D-alanyl-D-alanine carboxypeptidase family protein n=1 Tax=Staphylococcus sp. NRL 16/872 TaxID=2930131 RepID=UPI001FB48403|nr:MULTISPECIES: D-alanyl-D-alanine carboxypeptidase family protein [unclassified Staphylococcus]MCJ1655277.1 M15 family metallopeptidase [Staphylococcus sp. NRL 21/187]MCJ1661110.1 M15 family metallopeptidase [Staphylococcus sp. NRL 18/288]MCJ1667007.1 M15 family metallopeptidase [Staphylococcus sp. NRL 19/737]WEN69480.1 D-alanyl-D-alanine carboxypeptidase family protein [Staphylococcus sp. NRL 16/872]
MKKLFTVLVFSTLLLAACSNHSNSTDVSENDTQQQSDKSRKDQNVQKKHEKVIKNGCTYIDNILIVNKEVSLPSNFNPGENPESQQALQKMFNQAHKENLNLYKISGFRNYQTQVQLYNQYATRDGKKAADKYSARPGNSEHQTGLTYDVGAVGSDKNLYKSFGDTKEGKWIAKNAHKFGFIVRYPKGKEKITGYQYEPWHLRYLGKQTATKVYDSDQALEEYVGLK